MSDPTVHGTLPGTYAAHYSLAEIDAQCRKAARGAGCPWGLAEEAGKAARWLAARALPGPEALAALLKGPRNCPCAHANGPGCALRLGAMLSDRVERVAAGEAMTAQVAQPLLVLGQLGRAATATGLHCTLEWEGVRALCGPAGLSLECSGNVLTAATTLRCTSSGDFAADRSVRCCSRPVDPTTWAVLERLAARTYLPATEASRLSGAGAGTVDND